MKSVTLYTNRCFPPTDLVHSPKHLCFNCHYVHTQHFSELDIDQYSLSEPTAAVTPCSCDSEAILSGHDETQHCTFCSDVLNPTRTKPLTSAVGGSGLDSLRVACAVREPQNELEYSLVSGWPMGGAELQNKIFQTDKTPELREKKADEGEACM